MKKALIIVTRLTKMCRDMKSAEEDCELHRPSEKRMGKKGGGTQRRNV